MPIQRKDGVAFKYNKKKKKGSQNIVKNHLAYLAEKNKNNSQTRLNKLQEKENAKSLPVMFSCSFA